MSEEIPGKKEQVTAQDDFRKTFKDVEAPDDFDNKQDFLRWAVKAFDDDLQDDRDNRDQGIEDAKFAAGQQWDNAIKQVRKDASKPIMVFNRLIAFIAQVVGNRRFNETVIKIVADDNKHKDVARIREGLIRSIQKNSKANIAYNKALENQVISGMGNFEINLEYAHDDVFEQDIKINAINNTFSVVWDREYQEPTGEDATRVSVVETMLIEDFNRQWPDAALGDPTTDTRLLGLDNEIDQAWITNDEIRVVNFWRMRTRRRIVALLRDEDGTEDVVDITDMEPDEFQDRIVTNSAGVPVMREVDRKYAQLYVLTALDLLEGPYDLPISRVPVFAVPGWEINVGEYRVRFGLIRFLKDPQRLLNYWRSIIAEKLMLTPKGNWIATEEAVQGREDEWRQSHLTDDPLLIWNGDAGTPPQRVEPAQIEGALIQEAGMAAQDLRDISNLHEASLGQQSNEVSGKAINARVRVGETGTAIYQDNLNLAIEACGGVCNELIPHVYSSTRTIKILGEEGEELPPVLINDTTNPNAVDITAGKYSVSSTVGPDTVTKRAEAADSMLNMVNAAPETMAIALDKIIEAQDWPMSTEIARRLRSQLDTNILSEQDLTDAQKQQQAQAQQQAEAQAQQQQALFEAELRSKNASAEQAEANAIQAQANAAKAIASIEIDQFKAVSDVEDARVQRLMEAVKTFNEVTGETDLVETITQSTDQT